MQKKKYWEYPLFNYKTQFKIHATQITCVRNMVDIFKWTNQNEVENLLVWLDRSAKTFQLEFEIMCGGQIQSATFR